MPLYNMSFQIEYVIYGKDEKDAYINSVRLVRDIVSDSDLQVLPIFNKTIKDLKDIPDDWDGRCIAYNDPTFLTIEEHLSEENVE